MCGIVGLFAKSSEVEERLGEHLAAMLGQMNDRGPDSAGVAVYRDPAPAGSSKLTLHSRDPLDNRDRYKPVTYGSSHIQAISFLDGGRTDARTILTYGQSEDPGSPWSSDQTELFSRKQWVRFPFTPEQVDAARVSRTTVTASR